ncbi:MAG: FliA/WhiG family RNA polymerase sigma factor [Solirubrobacteraceae bacterium]|nr:FliA/WhiG family RNA polymerase sigma factor [Solirubrobacteraceae bacterium]
MQSARPAKTVVLAEQWRRYQDTRDRVVRDQLILAYSPMVKYLAGRMKSRMPPHVDVADLISFGLGGLIHAVERFDPDQGVAFELYATTRIRGAILDEMRAQDWVPRSVRQEARAIDRATTDLTRRLQRVPTETEVADELSMTPEELRASLLRISDGRVVALDAPRSFGGDDGYEASLGDTLADPDTTDPGASVDAADVTEILAHAIEQLDGRKQIILGLRYHEQLTFAEIGEVLSLTQSRVSQLHTAAVFEMRAFLPADLAA